MHSPVIAVTTHALKGTEMQPAIASLARIIAAAALLAAVTPLQGHGRPEMDAVRLTLLTWSNGLIAGDADAAASVLHPEYSPGPGLGPGFHVKMIQAGVIPVRGVELRHAFYEKVEGGDLRVSPLVFRSGIGTDFAWAVTLRHDGEAWKILAIEAAEQLPPELAERDLPEHHKLHDVRLRVRDADTGRLVAARIHVEDKDGVYWPPAGHMKNIPLGWREDVGGDVHIDGKTFAYVEPESVVPLPTGAYTLEIARGIEYQPRTVQLDVAPGPRPQVEVKLKRWVHMAAEGWYSGDTHVHFLSPSSALLESRAEDLNVVNVLATKWGELITDVEHFTGAPSVLSEPEHVVYYNEESRHAFLGHTVLLNLKRLVYPLSWGGALEGVGGGYDYPAMAHQADKAHAQGGHVAWAHFPLPMGELAVDVALGKVDSVDLMTWGDAFADQGRLPGVPGPAATWYRFLNCGFRLPATAGTDKMWNNQLVGSPRVYARLDDPFTYDNWISAIRAGRTFTTSGPMLELTAGGRGLGETLAVEPGDLIPVSVRVRSRLPVDYLEIVRGGEIVVRQENVKASLDWRIEAEVTTAESSWLAARVYQPGPLPYQGMPSFGVLGMPYFAHTSPIYLEMDGKAARSPEDAAFFAAWCDQAIQWARTQARFHDEAERDEVVALFERAKAVYLAQVEPEGQ